MQQNWAYDIGLMLATFFTDGTCGEKYAEWRGKTILRKCMLTILSLGMEYAIEWLENRINAKDTVMRLLKIRWTLSKRIANLS